MDTPSLERFHWPNSPKKGTHLFSVKLWRRLWPLWLAVLLLLGACGSASSTSDTARPLPTTRTVVDGLYVQPGNPLLDTARQLQQGGQTKQAAALLKLAGMPAGIWLAGQSGEFTELANTMHAAAVLHALPVIVLYNLPNRDKCGSFSANGQISSDAYKTWVDQIASVIGNGRAIVVVEPDAVPDLARGCLTSAQIQERYQLLQYAMKTIGGLSSTQTYLDAGNPGVQLDPTKLAQALVQAGIGYGRGFSANVSGFESTSSVVSWSQMLESMLHRPYKAVIDTSRNGNGPYTGPTTPGNPAWCNPPGRALGFAPKLNPGPSGIAAWLWVKPPGQSDGTCNGGPTAGQYWPRYAIGLALGNSP